MRSNLLAFALLITAQALFTLASAQTVQYRKLNVGGRVDITIPAHWYVRDTGERNNIAAAADAAADPTGTGSEPMHVSSLSVVSRQERPEVILRISFVAEPGSQADLQQELKRGKAVLVSELAEFWKEQAAQMRQIAAQQGGKYLGDEIFDFVQLGNKISMMISYRRASLTGGAPFRVIQYHIPMGTDKVLITISVQESASALMSPIVERIKNSLTIRR